MCGERLTELRKKAHLTQDELAKAIGLSKSLIEKLENGDKPGSLNTLNKIADYFCVSIDYLQGKEEPIKQQRLDVVNALLDKLIKNGVISQSDTIDPEIEEMILYAVKVEIAKKLKNGK